MARGTVEACFRIDVRPSLPAISVPTLVIHATDDVVPVQFRRHLADHIPGAQLVEVDGNDHALWFSDPDRITAAIEEFVTGTRTAPYLAHRALRTLLFSDIVGSTARAASLGDERWRALLEIFGEITTSLADRFGGRWSRAPATDTWPPSKDQTGPFAVPRPYSAKPIL
jgi:hypothetical protein